MGGLYKYYFPLISILPRFWLEVNYLFVIWRQWLVTEKARTQWRRYKAMLDDAKAVNEAPDIKMFNAKETNAISGKL